MKELENAENVNQTKPWNFFRKKLLCETNLPILDTSCFGGICDFKRVYCKFQ